MSRCLTTVFACVLAGFVSMPLAADLRAPLAAKQIVGAGYVFPSSANVQGAFGAYFRTRMVLTNPTGSPITIIAALSTPSGFSAERLIPLASAQMRIYENFLADVFGYTGGGGINLIEAGVLSGAPKPFVAVAEVYVDGANGRYSTPITGLFTDDQVVTPSKETGFSLVTGLRSNTTNRANFGCSNANPAPATVRAEIYTSSTPIVGSPALVEELQLVGGGWNQKAVPLQDDQIRILFSVVAGGGDLGVYCYGVNVNNASNDGTSIPAGYIPLVP